MKKIVFFTALTLMLVVLFTGCPQKVKPSQDSGDGARIFKDVKKVQIPIDIIKGFNGTSGNALMTDAMRTGLDYVKTVIASTGTTPSTTNTTADVIKPTYVEWQIGVSFDKDVDPFNESLILKHVTVQNYLAAASANNNVVNDKVSLSYPEIKQRRGRDIEVGDQFWVGFRAISSEGKEIARIKQHIEVANPSEVQSIKLHYGFDSYYLKATLNGKYPTTTAVFYLGADAKAAEVVAEAVNGQVHTNTTTLTNTTTFICKVPAEKLVKNQPYHARVTFKDVEVDAKGLERETAFNGVDIVYSDTASSAWNFQIGDIALAGEDDSGRKAVLLDTADPILEWNHMDAAAALYNTAFYNNINNAAVLKNPKYVIRLAETADGLAEADPARYNVVDTGTTMSADLSGLQFNKVYYAQVEFSYDIKEANSLARRSHKSPVVSFTTVNGLVSPLYTFDSGRVIPSFSTEMNPATLTTNGFTVNSGGNPSNALALASNRVIQSYGGKFYSKAELKMDTLLHKDVLDVMEGVPFNLEAYDAKSNPVPKADDDTDKDLLWRFTAGEVTVSLVYIRPHFYTSDDNGNDGANHDWTLVQGKVVLVVSDKDGSKKSDAALFTSATALQGTPAPTLSAIDYATVTGYTTKTVVNTANKNWIDPYALTINLATDKVMVELKSTKTDNKADVEHTIQNYKVKGLGYSTFEFKNRGPKVIHVDNVQYKITDEKFSRKVR